MLKNIANIINLKSKELEAWYQGKLLQASPCFYSSVDLRYSGNKLVPVDTNLFPAGFNNLNLDNFEQAAKEAKAYISSHFPKAQKILLIGEDHSRNLYYLDNLKTIENIIKAAGYQCQIGSLTAEEQVSYQGIAHNEINIFPFLVVCASSAL